MTNYLHSQSIRPELILTSSALRARSLAQTLSEGLDVDLQLERSLYTFDDLSLRTALSHLLGPEMCVAFVGHNPAVTQLASDWSNGEINHMPTSAVAVFEADAVSWNGLVETRESNDQWNLRSFVSPKMLAKDGQ